jgi:hypothetical protein
MRKVRSVKGSCLKDNQSLKAADLDAVFQQCIVIGKRHPCQLRRSASVAGNRFASTQSAVSFSSLARTWSRQSKGQARVWIFSLMAEFERINCGNAD